VVEARANFVMTLNSFLGLVSSFWLKGQPIACMYFVVFGYGTLQPPPVSCTSDFQTSQ
jgi:hypothetical protein